MTDLAAATTGVEVRVDVNAIEKSLTELWRGEGKDEHALTRAALWNVVAHTTSHELQTEASEALARASAAIPQRTIIVRANAADGPELASWISANCHLAGGGKQVCSEEITLVAGGDRIHRLPPVVNALLIPDMPVAVWWLGDLPQENEDYVLSILEPADRLIVDSADFDSATDLMLISRVAQKTATAPADLNWVRLEEWRAATASVFDPPAMRTRLRSIRSIRVVAAIAEGDFFGDSAVSLLYAAWISTQAGHVVDSEAKVEGAVGPIDYRFERRQQSAGVGGISLAEISFDDGSSASITRDRDRGVLVANVDGNITAPASVTRTLQQATAELIVRQLKRSEGDRVLLQVLPVAARLSRRIFQ